MTRDELFVLRARLRTEFDEHTVEIVDHMIWCIRCYALSQYSKTKTIWLTKLAKAYFEQQDLGEFVRFEQLVEQLVRHVQVLYERRTSAQKFIPNVTFH